MINSFFIFVFLFLSSPSVWADFKVPNLSSAVQDEAGVFSNKRAQQIEGVIVPFAKAGKAQIQILTLESLEGLPIEDVSIKITDAWQLGDKSKDNGILILLAVKEKKVRIEVGQGLEGELPDAIASRIIRETMIPEFRKGDYSSGLAKGTLRIIDQIDPQFLQNYSDQVGSNRSSKQMSDEFSIFLFFIVLFIAFILQKITGGRMHRGFRHGGGFGGGYPGGGWSSGGGGGGWSGGGGGFSGGGASGDW